MTGRCPFLRFAGALVALTFAVQTTLLPAVHPCMAHDAMGGGGHVHDGTAPPAHATHDGMDAAAMGPVAEGAGDHRGDAPAPNESPCTCADCACCAATLSLPQTPGSLLVVSVAFVDPPVAMERDAVPVEAPDVLLPPAIGPPAVRGVSLT